MDIKEYIESGILEEYVSGLLTDKDNEEVDRIAGLYPEVQDEIDEIRSAYNLLANRLGIAPDSSVLEKSLAQISSNIDEEIVPAQKEESKDRSGILLYAIAAVVTLLLVSTAINFYFFFQIDELNQNYSEAVENLSVIQNTSAKKIIMTGLPNSPESHASLYWNEQTKDIYIQVGDLPVPPSGHQYQLWAEIDGVMVNMGVFHHNQSLQHITKYDGIADAFDVTLEVEGGSETATVENAYLRGAI